MEKETKKQYLELWLKLIGEEWSGKSSSGNTIMGQNVFEVDGETENVLQSSGVIEGRNVTVVDTPGWDFECSPDVPLKIVKKSYSSESVMCPGFHVLLLTIPISQSEQWNRKLAQRLSNALKLFNEDIWKHTMLLFTRSDLLHFSGFEGFLKGSGQPFQSLMEKCERRYHVLDNRKKNDHKQIRELLEKIERTIQENDGRPLQFITEEKKVTAHEMKTLRLHEQFEERYSKMEEHHEEKHFRLEEFMFKSLRPGENIPPKSEMEHPVDMQDSGLECFHIQDQDTESTSDRCSESPAETNRAPAIISGVDGDTETRDRDQNAINIYTAVEQPSMDRIGDDCDDDDVDDDDGDEEKNHKYLQDSTLQRNTLAIRDTYSFYSTVSNHEHTAEIHINVYWRKLEPSCQEVWISFTVCGDDITQLFVMVLYLFVGFLDLVYTTYEEPKETGNQIINPSVHGFVESQEVQEISPSLLRQDANKWTKSLDEEITKGSKKEDDDEGIPQHNTRGVEEELKQCGDEVLPEHLQKGEVENEANDKKNLQQSKKGAKDDEPLIQHIHQGEEKENKELPQHGQKTGTDDGELLQPIHQGEEDKDKELPQHGQKGKGDNEELPQHIHQSEEAKDKELPQHGQKGEEDNEELPQHIHQNEEGKDKELPQHGQKGKGDNEELLRHTHQSEEGKDKELPHHGQKGEEDNEELPQHGQKGEEDNEELLQPIHQGEEGKDKELPHHGQKGEEDNEELPQQGQKGEENNEELLQFTHQSKEGKDKELPQLGQKGEEDNEELLQYTHQGEEKDDKLPQLGQKGEEDNEELLQYTHQGEEKDDKLPQHGLKCEDDDKELLQHIYQGKEVAEQPQHAQKGKDKELLQSIHKDNKDEKLPHPGQELPQNVDQVNKDERSQQIQSTNKEIPRHGCNEDYENRLQQRKRVGDDHSLQCSIKKDEKQIFQTNKEDYEVMDQQRNADEGEEIHKLLRRDDGRSRSSNIYREGGWGQPGDVNNSAGVQKTDKTSDKKRARFGRTRNFVRSQDAGDKNIRQHRGIRKAWSLERVLRFKREYATGEEDTRQHGRIWKIRRDKSLERFDVFNSEYGEAVLVKSLNPQKVGEVAFGPPTRVVAVTHTAILTDSQPQSDT